MTARLLGRWDPDDPEWHEVRRTRIGGSDIGSICGWGYRTRDQVMAEKLGEAHFTGNKATERGRYCEPAILEWLADTHSLDYNADWVGTWAAQPGWPMATPDAVTTTGTLVEAKTCAARDAAHGWGRAGTAHVPLAYAAQCHWSMGVLELDHCILAVLSGAPRFEFARYRLTFDPDVFAYLITQAEDFRADLARHLQERTAA